MAGQRMYYSNVQTNARGAVRLTAQINFDGTAVPSVVNGPGFAVTGSGATSVYTVFLPEKFAQTRLHRLDASFANATTLLSLAAIGAYTVPTTSTASSLPLTFVLQANATQTVTVNPKGTLYFEVVAELGM